MHLQFLLISASYVGTQDLRQSGHVSHSLLLSDKYDYSHSIYWEMKEGRLHNLVNNTEGVTGEK